MIKKLVLAGSIYCMATVVTAGGYRVAIQGQQQMGMGHTGVAASSSAETVFFNPAGMSFLDSKYSASAGLTGLKTETQYKNDADNSYAETDNALGTPIGLYSAYNTGEGLAYGFGIYTPYGNNVSWETDWAGSHLVNNIDLKAIFFQPSLSYQVNEKFSLGGGIIYALGSVEFNRNLSPTLANAAGDRANVTIEESNVGAWGYTLGAMMKPNDQLSLGINYRSLIDIEAEGGEANFENIPAGILQAVFVDTTFDATLPLPAELTIGASYDFNEKLTVAFDINRAFWSEYESLDIAFGSNDPRTGQPLASINPRNYKDANTYRLGAAYKFNDKLTVRGGMYFDESPVRDGYFAPETPRNDSIGITAGMSYQFTERLAMDASLLFLTFDEVDNSYDYYTDPLSGSTTSFGGTYDSGAIAGGIGISYRL